MVHLFLVRHGETEENVAQILQGHLPGTLTERGREQAAALRQNLAACRVRFDILLYSDLKRTADTAEILNRRLQLPTLPCPLLRERDWGAATGEKIGTVRLDPLPPGIETEKAMFDRARRCLIYIRDRFDGLNVLAVGHGLFNRCLLATLAGCAIRDIPRMANAEIREAAYDSLPRESRYEADEVSAD